MLERAEKVILSLSEDYLVWVNEDLHRLQGLYELLEKTPPAEARPVLRELFSVAHDMKGQGGTFGYPLITTFATSLYEFVGPRAEGSA